MKIITVIFCSVSLTYAAGWPTVDMATVTALMQQAKQGVTFFEEEMKMFNHQLSAHIQGTSAQVDTMNNGFANAIVRNEQTQNTIYNQQLSLQMQPSVDACASYSVSNQLNDATCSFLNAVSNSSQKRMQKFLNKERNLSATASSQENAKKIIHLARHLNNGAPPGEEDNTVSPLALRADILMGSEGDTFDKTNMQSTEVFNDILVGPGVTEVPSIKNANDQVGYVNNYLRPNAIRALAAASMDTIRSLRLGQDNDPSQPSVMQLLQQFADSHFGTPEGNNWLKNITNTQDSASDFMSDSAVMRSIAQMQAYSNYVAMMNYQSQLRQEMLEAAMLSLQNKMVYGE